MNIPFNIPHRAKNEMKYVQDALARGQISGDGYYTNLIKELFMKNLGAKGVFMTTSCSHALEMAALLINLQEGDEVIMPSFTFPSTANSVLLRKSKPIFAEINGETLNIEVEDIKRKITKRTKAIIPVHYGGIACDMAKIMDLAGEKNLYIIEDAAQGVNSEYHNKKLGTIGHFGCYSFHGTKNYSCGEGGALVINVDSPLILERADIIRQKGTNRTKFLKGEIDQYMWVDVGSSYLPSDILMAYLYAQFEEIETITLRRKKVHEHYSHSLESLEKAGTIRLPHIPLGYESNYHIYYILLENNRIRDCLLSKLHSLGIYAATHFFPLHSSPMGRRLGYQSSDLPLTQQISESLIRLPIYPNLNEEQLDYVTKNLCRLLKDLKVN